MEAPGAPGMETPGQDRGGEEDTDPKGNAELRCPVWLVESGGGQSSWTHQSCIQRPPHCGARSAASLEPTLGGGQLLT